jgi:type IV secretion system protein VirD4
MIVQNLTQLDELYGQAGHESILQNSALQLFFAANDETTARYVSERLGIQTIQTVSCTYPSGSRLAQKTYSHAARALLLPEEVRRIGTDEALLFKEGMHPVRSRKLQFYRDRAFVERKGMACAVVPELRMPGLPRAGARRRLFEQI